MPMELLNLSENDVDRIAEIFHACLHLDYVDVLPSTVIDSFTLESSRALWQKSYANQVNAQFVGAFVDGKLAGFAKYGTDSAVPDKGYLASLYVDPLYSGQGIGRALLNYVLLKLHSYSHIRLWVFATNPKAIALYESLGFRKTGVTRIEEEWQALQSELELDNSQPS